MIQNIRSADYLSEIAYLCTLRDAIVEKTDEVPFKTCRINFTNHAGYFTSQTTRSKYCNVFHFLSCAR